MAKKKGKRRNAPNPADRVDVKLGSPAAPEEADGVDEPEGEDAPEEAERAASPDDAAPKAPPARDEAPAPSSPEPLVSPAGDAPVLEKMKAEEVHPVGAAWAKPFNTFDRAFTWFEIRLLMLVIFGLVVSMVAWVVLKGMAEPLPPPPPDLSNVPMYVRWNAVWAAFATGTGSPDAGGNAGTTVRCLLGMSVFGALALAAVRRWGKKLTSRQSNGVIAGAILVGGLLGPTWRAVGVDYAEHMLNWLQEGSSLTMFGGLRGVSTRLTILLALVGASLAAATGKHINIDVVVRFVPERLKKAVLVVCTVATMGVCVIASWGFFDYSSIDGFGADRHWTPGQKYDQVSKVAGQSFFLWRKQIGLDLDAAPHVIKGGRWDEPTRLNGAQWNEMIEKGGFREQFTKEQVDALLTTPEALSEPRVPLVIAPDRSARGLMIPIMNLFFPIGFLILAIRFGVRCILVLTGWHVDKEQGAGESEPIPSEAA